ncbi:MAG: 50S ribosomal protein L17 [Cryomorphaceae bacterium]|nr:MAG: 50S ribosomal protein L17 [Cryomorphaceae bacterium]
MRHGKKINPLGRKKGHRELMLSNMACSLIEHKRINTTLAKGKELRKYVEPLITKSKEDSTHSRRVVFSYLRSKEAVTELFREVAPKIAERPGGYVRILKTGRRLGDGAELCMVELVDFNELLLNTEKKTKSRRSRRGGKKQGAPEATPAAEAEVKQEEPKGEAAAAEATEAAPAETSAEAEDTTKKATDEDPEASAPDAAAGETPASEEKKEEGDGETKKDEA